MAPRFLLLLAAPRAYADDVVSYALVVGSNAPGPGQDQLAFAEDVLGDPGRIQAVTEVAADAPEDGVLRIGVAK